MKRGKKLIWLLAVLAVLVGLMFLIPMLTQEEEVEEPDTSIQLLSVDPDAVTALSWTHEGEVLSFHMEDIRWICESDPGFPTLKSTINTMLDALAPLTAASVIEAPGDLSQYGLDAPALTITYTENGQTTTVQVGNENNLGGLRYVSVGDGKVYLVTTSLYSCYDRGMFDVMVKDTLPTMVSVDGVTIVSGGETVEVEVTDSLTYSISSLKWLDYADYSADDLSVYGLDEPVSLLVLYTDAESSQHTLQLDFGSETEQGTYAKMAESNMVYYVSTELVQTILSAE